MAEPKKTAAYFLKDAYAVSQAASDSLEKQEGGAFENGIEQGESLQKMIEAGGAPLFEPDDGPAVRNRSLKNNLRRFWVEHSEGFKKFWTELSFLGKRDLLETCVANLPDALTDKLKHENSLEGASVLLTPEMNIKDLVSSGERSLIALYEHWCSSEMADDLAHARELVRGLLDSGRPPRRYPSVFILLADLANHAAGGWIECKEGTGAKEAFLQLEKAGCAIQKDVYDFAHGRIGFVLTSLALVADYYRAEMLGLDKFFVSSPRWGCSECGKTETSEGRELIGCRDCVNQSRVMFCSKVCQRAHFASHKLECLRLKKGGASNMCQLCGDAEAEGGGALKKCARCQAKYCSKECQVAAWHAGHKRECHASAH